MNQLLSQAHWSAKGHDIGALVAASLATVSTHAVSQMLNVIVLFLTVVFLALGIVMRWQKLKLGVIDEVDKEDEPINQPRKKRED